MVSRRNFTQQSLLGCQYLVFLIQERGKGYTLASQTGMLWESINLALLSVLRCLEK